MHRFQDSLAGCDMPGLSINIDLDYPQPPMPPTPNEPHGGSSLRTSQPPLGNSFGECEYIPDPRRKASTLTENTDEYLPTLECVEVSDAPICDEFSLDSKGGLSKYLPDPILDACMQIMDMIDKCDKSKHESDHDDKDTPPTIAHQGKSDHSDESGKTASSNPFDKAKDDKVKKPDMSSHESDSAASEEKDNEKDKEEKDE